jgi:DNA polymerase sigma
MMIYLIVYHLFSNIACDLTITNRIARRKTLLLEAYAKADPRVRPILFAVKRWVKARKIGDATEQGGSTVNSYTHSLMVIAFLQWVKVVPVLQYICCFGGPSTRDQIRAYNSTDAEVEDQLIRQLNGLSILSGNANGTTADVQLAYGDGQPCRKARLEHTCRVCGRNLPSHVVEGSQTYFYTGVVPQSPNKQSVAHLLIEFFRFYALIFKNEEHCVSPRVGGLIMRSTKQWEHRFGSAATRRNGDLPAFCVEDPFETNHNCALSAKSTFWPGLRWEYERAMRILLFEQDTAELYKNWKTWPAAAYGALGIW